MKKILVSICALASIAQAAAPKIIDPAYAFVSANVMGERRLGFHKAMQLMSQRNIKTIVETGTARGGDMAFTGDGGFTIVFGLWALLYDAHLYSVDILEFAINRAKTMVKPYMNHITFTLDDSVHYLQEFDRTIDFLYLDSFDYEKTNPLPSQQHHLKEIEAAYEKLAPNAIVMIDDCKLPGGGKGRLAINYLKERGWKVVLDSYQVIMVRS